MKILFGLTALMLLAGCATDLIATQPEPRASRDKDFYSVIENYSSVETDFEGFENTFQYRTTFHNSEVRKVLIGKMAEYYQWEPSKVSTEQEKANQENASEAQFFVSFFTPERQNNNLSDAKSIWRILLEVNGQKFTGKVKKMKSLLAELQALYPYHSRWNTPYLITFPVAANHIEGQKVKLTITGPLGTRAVEINSVRP